MAANAFVRARIDETLRNEAAAVLGEMGLTLSDVVRIVLTRIAKEKALPFELKVPNAASRAAMIESRELMQAPSGRYADPDELFDALEQKTRK